MASLDTTVLVDVLRRRSRFHQRAREKIDELMLRGEVLATTRFTLAELWVGIELSDNPQKDQADMEAVLANLGTLEFGNLSARLFGQFRAEQRRLGRITGDIDTLIAATSLAAGHRLLVTRNPDHFAGIPGLAVESY